MKELHLNRQGRGLRGPAVGPSELLEGTVCSSYLASQHLSISESQHLSISGAVTGETSALRGENTAQVLEVGDQFQLIAMQCED